VLDRHSQDESARQSCRPLVHYGSLKHKWLYLRASILYGSITNNYAFDIFKQNRKEMKGLLLFDCFHLQHGIVNQDMSESLHRYNKNHIAMTASTQQEAEGFLLYPYGYERKEILLTGLARLDKAFPIRKMQRGRRVVIAPTYREWLVGSSLDKELHKEIKPGFEKSQFFIFYNSLVNSPQLHKALKKYGYNLLLRLHPSFYNAAKYFQANEFCEISTGDARAYQECLKDTAILITDYSSIAFDYAFAHCPIVYTQFDREEFFNRHLYQDGYFNHENDGFGPVCYSLEDAVQKIIGILTGGVKMEQVYKDRVRSFFQFNDDKNCERIFDATLNIEQSRNRI
jgi:CDP-glycerol glycerophosphotransferase (TagB/SpsB family)